MTYGQAVRAAVTKSVQKTGTDTAWHYLINPMYRSSIINHKKLVER